MLLNEEIDRIKNLMNLSEGKKIKNLFKDFDISKFKNVPESNFRASWSEWSR